MTEKECANRQLTRLTFNKYFTEIPLTEMKEILSRNNIKLLQEDNTEWEGFVCGREGNTLIKTNIKANLYLSWYQMASGRYEVTTYLS